LGLIDSILSKERVREAYRKIQSMCIPDLDIVTGDSIYSCSLDNTPPENRTIPFGGCAAGVSGLTILPDGTLLPCRRLNVPLGNILKDNVRSLWATSPVLTSLRNKKKYKGKCRTCEQWAQCRGCRAIAYQHSLLKGRGNYLSEDPQCFVGE
jgi:radical SAM protein with 4Fe4S-binding SPASM domain